MKLSGSMVALAAFFLVACGAPPAPPGGPTEPAPDPGSDGGAGPTVQPGEGCPEIANATTEVLVPDGVTVTFGDRCRALCPVTPAKGASCTDYSVSPVAPVESGETCTIDAKFADGTTVHATIVYSVTPAPCSLYSPSAGIVRIVHP
jgi:hypothetical protein